MATSKRDTLVVGLRNAYALEGEALSTMENVRSRLKHYPDLELAVAHHMEETRQQQKLLEECLHRFGEKPSTLKDMATKLVGNVQAIFHAAASDEVLKNIFALYSFEHYEIAAYTSLIDMADSVQEPSVAQTCRQILEQEQAAAQKLHGLIAPVTRSYIEREASGVQAAR